MTFGACTYAVSLAKKVLLNTYISFDAALLCGEENYKYLELFTNFLLLTHAPTARKRKLVTDLSS